MKLRTTTVSGIDEIRAFFDRLAPDYQECHGAVDRLLAYRLSVIDWLTSGVKRGCLIEIACGTGAHLLAMADRFERLIGTDLAPQMIHELEKRRAVHPLKDRISVHCDSAEELASIADSVADIVLCVGALEHLLDRASVLRQVRRVLKPGGAFVCLTPNGEWIWYSWLAPLLRLPTRHLSSDRFIGADEFSEMLAGADLHPEIIDYWSFVPRGDIPRPLGWLLGGLDSLGRVLGISKLRGGLCTRAVKA